MAVEHAMRDQAGRAKRVAPSQPQGTALLAESVRDAPDLVRSLAGERPPG
jgi:hypothetical protein